MSSFIDCVTDFTEQISQISGRADEDAGFQQLLQKRKRWSDSRLIDEDPADYYRVLPIQLAKPLPITPEGGATMTPADSVSKAHNQRIDRNAAIIQGGGIPPFPLYKKLTGKGKGESKDVSGSAQDSLSKDSKKNKEKSTPPKEAEEPATPKEIHFKGSWWVQECVALGNIFKSSAFLEITKIISGAIVAGQVVTGPGIAEGTKIRNPLKSGEGKQGTFFLTKAQNEPAEDVLLNFKGTIIRADSVPTGAFLEGQTILGEGIPTGTTILTSNLPEISVLYEESIGNQQLENDQTLEEKNINEQTVDTIDIAREGEDVDTELDDSTPKGTYVDFVGDGRRVKTVVIIPPSNKNKSSKTKVGYHALSIPSNMEMEPKECPDGIDIYTDGARPDGFAGGSVFINEIEDMEERYDGHTRVVKSKRDGKGYRYDYHCRHGKRKYRCKECGGSAFCFHGKERHRCKDCGVMCAHNLDRNVCEVCASRKKERISKRNEGKLPGQVDDDITDDEDDDYEYNSAMEGSNKEGNNLYVNQNVMLKTDADPMPGESGYRPSANNLVLHPNPEGVSLIFDWNTYTWMSPESLVRKHEEQTSTLTLCGGDEPNNDNILSNTDLDNDCAVSQHSSLPCNAISSGDEPNTEF